ncbi:MAG: hypothetical protein QM704_07065 [Anaeromyxobacteraceae bacterium]
MPGKLKRFLHLERPRGPDTDGPAPTADPGRFDALEGTASPGSSADSGPLRGPTPGTSGPPTPAAAVSEAARFGPDHDPGLQLAERDPAARPFQRCPACGRDHGLHEVVCTCGARLDTPEVQAWNDRLWAERAAEDARLSAEGEAARERARREAEELAKLKYEMGVELARQVGDRERRRLGVDGGLGGGLDPVGGGAGSEPLWNWLVERFPAAHRLTITVGLGVAWLVLLAGGLLARRGGVVLAAIVILLALVVPPRAWARRTRRGIFRSWGSWD